MGHIAIYIYASRSTTICQILSVHSWLNHGKLWKFKFRLGHLPSWFMSKLNQPTHVFPCLSRKYIWKSLRPFWSHPLCSCAGRGGAGKFDLGFPSQCRIIIVVWSEEKTANNSLRFPLWVEKTFLSYSGWRFLSFMAKTTNRCDHTSGLDQPRPRSCAIKSDKKGTSTTLGNWWLMTLRRHSRKLAMLTIHNVRNILGSSSVCYSVLWVLFE